MGEATMVNQTPILFLGDSPSIQGGLSRIGRDLVILTSRMEEFRVGFLGRGGLYSRHLGFAQYNYPEFDGWGENYLQDVWYNFAGDEPGIVFTIWDPSRLLWLNPGHTNQAWLRQRPFKLWGYFPIDHEGVGGRLSLMETEALRGYDRVLAYGIYGSTVMSNTLGYKEAVDFIPHGVNLDVFQPRDGAGARTGLGIAPKATVLGVVMTNQTRKDWGLAFETMDLLRKQIPKLKVWCKTDSIDRHWDLRALTADFNLQDTVVVDISNRNDTELSYLYSMCDLTFLPSLGEGFGYPIVESLACGVPCVHGSYGGGTELLPDESWAVKPVTYRYETQFNCKRPVYSAEDWRQLIVGGLAAKQHGDFNTETLRASVDHLNWSNLHIVWERWMREGVR
jgi:glycosyltransferase involved in cell wall biosynthesis